MGPRNMMLVLVAVAVMACGSNPSAPDVSEQLPVVRIRPEPASLTYNSGLSQAQQVIVRDRASWEQTWAAIWRNHSPQPELPAVDFSREMIVVAALGSRPTGGYGIFIDSASSGPSGVEIAVRAVSPGNGCAVTLAITNPVDAARVPRREGPIRFSERREIQECR